MKLGHKLSVSPQIDYAWEKIHSSLTDKFWEFGMHVYYETLMVGDVLQHM